MTRRSRRTRAVLVAVAVSMSGCGQGVTGRKSAETTADTAASTTTASTTTASTVTSTTTAASTSGASTTGPTMTRPATSTTIASTSTTIATTTMSTSTTTVVLTAPDRMPEGNPWETVLPVDGPQVWHTRDGRPPTGRVVALTFDDGPATDTQAIVDILQRERVPATFFVVGQMVEQHPDLLRRLRSLGYGIGAHTMTHPRLDELAPAEADRELTDSADAIDRTIGAPTAVCFRPPFGMWTPHVAQTAARRGLAVVNWTTDSVDYRRPEPDRIVERVMTHLPDGAAIVLLHDGPTSRGHTVEALPGLIARLRAEGYSFVRVC